jgi:hypothetical protein
METCNTKLAPLSRTRICLVSTSLHLMAKDSAPWSWVLNYIIWRISAGYEFANEKPRPILKQNLEASVERKGHADPFGLHLLFRLRNGSISQYLICLLPHIIYYMSVFMQ